MPKINIRSTIVDDLLKSTTHPSHIPPGKVYSSPNYNPPPYKPHGPWSVFPSCESHRETDKAIFVEIHIGNDDKFEWMPKSHISDDSEVYKAGQTGKLIITEWLAKQKGLVPDPLAKKPDTTPSPSMDWLDLSEPHKVYRVLARKYHPDMNPSPQAKEFFQDLTGLWQAVLKLKDKE